MIVPKDPVMLLSYVNTQLRDFYSSLADFCKAANIGENEILDKLASINYEYDEKKNRFV
ncbi:MAG: DUF4250 domain-containing protein [Lachnospiraceae bacterium]|nr:DUF4250 domain-containing protein [Lachnospiraceae bacterium]